MGLFFHAHECRKSRILGSSDKDKPCVLDINWKMCS